MLKRIPAAAAAEVAVHVYLEQRYQVYSADWVRTNPSSREAAAVRDYVMARLKEAGAEVVVEELEHCDLMKEVELGRVDQVEPGVRESVPRGMEEGAVELPGLGTL